MPERMKLFDSTNKTKNWENVPSLEIVEEVLYTFSPKNSYVYLLNVEPSNLLLLTTYNTEFDEILITFTD